MLTARVENTRGLGIKSQHEESKTIIVQLSSNTIIVVKLARVWSQRQYITIFDKCLMIHKYLE